MRIMRSFPLPGKIPPGRAHVADNLDKLYTPLSELGSADFSALRKISDPVILVEWDVAVDSLNLQWFADYAMGRDWPIVAPHYKITEDGQKVWVHFVANRNGELRPVQPGDPACDQFALGLVYFPGGLLRDCPLSDTGSQVMNEGVISRYLHTRPDWRPVPIMWDIQTVHLH